MASASAKELYDIDPSLVALDVRHVGLRTAELLGHRSLRQAHVLPCVQDQGAQACIAGRAKVARQLGYIRIMAADRPDNWLFR